MFASYEELGKKLRQSIMVPTAEKPKRSPQLPAQTNPHSDLPYRSFTSVSCPALPQEDDLLERSLLPGKIGEVQGGQVGDH